MVFALAFFAFFGLIVVVVPAAVLGLTTALVSARRALPLRILLILAAAAAAVVVWTLLLRDSYLMPVAVTLAGLAALGGGGLNLLWATTHRRVTNLRGQYS